MSSRYGGLALGVLVLVSMAELIVPQLSTLVSGIRQRRLLTASHIIGRGFAIAGAAWLGWGRVPLSLTVILGIVAAGELLSVRFCIGCGRRQTIRGGFSQESIRRCIECRREYWLPLWRLVPRRPTA